MGQNRDFLEEFLKIVSGEFKFMIERIMVNAADAFLNPQERSDVPETAISLARPPAPDIERGLSRVKNGDE